MTAITITATSDVADGRIWTGYAPTGTFRVGDRLHFNKRHWRVSKVSPTYGFAAESGDRHEYVELEQVAA